MLVVVGRRVRRRQPAPSVSSVPIVLPFTVDLPDHDPQDVGLLVKLLRPTPRPHHIQREPRRGCPVPAAQHAQQRGARRRDQFPTYLRGTVVEGRWVVRG